MMGFWIWFVLASGVFGIMTTLAIQVKGGLNFIFFKVLPFFSSIGAIIFFLLYIGLV